MSKLTTPGHSGPGTLLLSKLGKTVRTATLRKVAPVAKPAQPVPAKPIMPTHTGPGEYEDFFAADLRAAADHHQIVMDQIKAVQRDGSKPINAAALLRRE